MKQTPKKFENFKRSSSKKNANQEQKHLDDALSSAIASAELKDAQTGEIAKEKAKQVYLQNEQALKKIEEKEKEIKEKKNKKIEFSEYKPTFKDTLAFKFIILFIVFAVIGAGIGIYFYIKNLNKELPSSLTLSATEVYYSGGDDFTLTCFLNADYNGMNKNIKISHSGGNGIIQIDEKEVLSGKPFTVKVIKKNNVPVGGKVRIWVEDSASGKQRAYCDLIIDTPITSVVFNNTTSEVYVTESVDFSAVAKTASTINDISTALGKQIEYRIFKEKSGGSYIAVMDGSKIDHFEEVETIGTGDFDLIQTTGDIATVNAITLTFNDSKSVFVEASVRKWLPQNSDDEVIYKVKEVTGKLIPITSFELNSMYEEFNYVGKINYADIFVGYGFDSNRFTTQQVAAMQKFFTVSSSNANVIVQKDDLGFTLEFNSETTTDIEIAYNDGVTSISETITVNA